MRFLAAVVVLLLSASAAFADKTTAAYDWQTIRTKHFRFDFVEPDRKVTERLAKDAEKIRADVTHMIGFDFKAVTTVVVAPDVEAYNAVQSRSIVPEWSVGTANWRRNRIVLLSPRGGFEVDKRLDIEGVFKHEVSHIILGRALAGVENPNWLDEGIAKYQSEPWNIDKSWAMTVASLSDQLIPLQKLNHWWPKDEKRARIAYLQSQAFVDYLFRQAKVHVLVEHLREGRDIETALFLTTGYRGATLDDEFKDFFEREYTWVNLLIGDNVIWGAASLIFLVVVVISFRRSRLKLRRMELEDELEDLYAEQSRARLGRVTVRPSKPPPDESPNGANGRTNGHDPKGPTYH
ncbi:hypothetical protein KDL45_13715 [bacterium]|nr:hypothetical protein [bacterium]